jgi:hypothetical protein
MVNMYTFLIALSHFPFSLILLPHAFYSISYSILNLPELEFSNFSKIPEENLDVTRVGIQGCPERK